MAISGYSSPEQQSSVVRSSSRSTPAYTNARTTATLSAAMEERVQWPDGAGGKRCTGSRGVWPRPVFKWAGPTVGVGASYKHTQQWVTQSVAPPYRTLFCSVALCCGSPVRPGHHPQWLLVDGGPNRGTR
ncbi:uncharacterized protein LOC144150115 isoform X3 [Haemaphysalis longicornis]